MSKPSAAIQLTAVNSACHCSLALWLVLAVVLVLCTGVLAWRHRSRGIGGRWPMLRFALLWGASLLVLAVRIGAHDVIADPPDSDSGLAPRSTLAAQADSICAGIDAAAASDEDKILNGYDVATQAVRGLKGPGTATLEWRRFVASAVAVDRQLAAARDHVAVTSAVRAKRERAERKGDASAVALGIDCPLL